MSVVTLVIFGRHSEEIGELLSEDQAATEKRRPERRPFDEFAWKDRYGG
jgi:hypothetical protein